MFLYINVNAAASDLKTIKKNCIKKQRGTKASPKHKNETKSILAVRQNEGNLKGMMKWEDDEESELCLAC